MSATYAASDDSQELRRACAALRERLRSGESSRVEDILALYPSLANKDEAIIELIHAEIATRHDLGERLTLADWQSRFPSLLRRQEDIDALRHILGSEMRTVSDGTPAQAADPLGTVRLPGQSLPRVGNYQLLQEIGRGGMGVVYKARQPGLTRTVALKMILAGEHAGLRDRARLRNEAEAAAQLQHPNVVQVYEIGEHEGLPFLAMEFVAGGNLLRMLRGMPQAFRWAARLTETLARAIHVAHDRKIIHRDLNPSNILMTPDGIPKISDFGLAKFLLDDAGVSLNGLILGTPSYMAPEQVSPQRAGIGPATDVYALGAILYEMLTGTAPFRGFTPMETMCQVAEAEIVAPSRLRHGVPQDLETICVKCLEKEPSRRYASALELAEDLRRFQDNEPILARRTSWVRQVLQWSRRQPLAAGLLALSFLLMLAVSGLSVGFLAINARWEQDQTKHEVESSQASIVSDIRTQDYKTQLKEKPRLRYDHQLRQIKEYIETGAIEVAEELFKKLEPQSETGFEMYFLDSLIHAALERLDGHESPVTSLALARGGGLMVSGDSSGIVRVWDLASRASKACEGEHDGPVHRLAVTTDGPDQSATIASVLQRDDGSIHLRLFDARSGASIRSFHEAIAQVSSLEFSPDGRTLSALGIASSSQEKTCWQWRLGPGGWIAEKAPTFSMPVVLAYSADCRLIASARGDGTVHLEKAADHSATELEKCQGAQVLALAFSPDGRQLAASRGDGGLTVWDTLSGHIREHHADGKSPKTLVDFVLGGTGLVVREGARELAVERLGQASSRQVLTDSGQVGSVRRSPDGTLVAAVTGDRLIRIWELATGRVLTSYVASAGDVHELFFSPDGKSLILGCSDRDIRIWHFAGARDFPQVLAGHPSSILALAFSPDDQILASASSDHAIKLWDRQTGRELTSLDQHEDAVTGLAFLSARTLVSAGLDGRLLRWELSETGGGTTEIKATPVPIHQHDEPYTALAVRALSSSVDEAPVIERLAVGGQRGTIQIWDTANGNIVHTLANRTGAVQALAYCGPNALASTSPDGTLRLWSTATGDEASKLERTTRVVASLPDGDLIAIMADQREIRLLSISAANRSELFSPHPLISRGLAFSRDGQIIASGCDDGIVRLWDVRTELEIFQMQGHQAPIQALTFSHDGATLASCDQSGRLILWHAREPRARASSSSSAD